MRASVARPAYALLLALLVVAPLLRPGYLLLRDAVSTPRSYLSDTALGLTSAPRATPQDFAVALASSVVDGGIVVKVLLVLGLWLAGLGAARLVAVVLPSAGLGGQFVAITLAIWNPYVAERLLQGHWSLLVGYGCLPWVAAAMLTLRSAGGAFFGLGLLVALAGLTPTGLLLAATVALVCVAAPGSGRPRWLCAAAAVGVAVVAALPWLVAAVVGSSLTASTGRLGVTVFAARAEPGLGTLGSLASLGGIWNGEAVPDSRTTLFAVLSAVVLLGVVVVGLPVVGASARGGAAAGAGGGGRYGAGVFGDRPRSARAGRGGGLRARTRCAARRAEVGGAGDAGIRAGRGRRGGDAGAVAAAASGRRWSAASR